MTHENDTTTIKMLEPIPSQIEIVTVEPPVEKMNSIVSPVEHTRTPPNHSEDKCLNNKRTKYRVTADKDPPVSEGCTSIECQPKEKKR